MPTYDDALTTLDTELGRVHEVFAGLTSDDWTRPTKLEPLDDTKPHWTVFELAGHFDISIGLTNMLMAEPTEGQPGRDRASFFIFPRAEVAPVVYDYAYTMVEGRTPADMPDVLHETFTRAVEDARERPPAASAKIEIYRIAYDPSGPDTGTNRHLNREMIVLRNTGSTDRNLGNWLVRDLANWRYRLPAGFKLKAGRCVRIHTGNGSDDGNDLYWGRGWYVWNNTGDRATLKNKVGDVKDRCRHQDGHASVRC